MELVIAMNHARVKTKMLPEAQLFELLIVNSSHYYVSFWSCKASANPYTSITLLFRATFASTCTEYRHNYIFFSVIYR